MPSTLESFVRSFARSPAAAADEKDGREDPVLSNLHVMSSVGCSLGSFA